MAALVGLRPLDGSHERVRYRRSVIGAAVLGGGGGGALGGREPVEGDADGEVQGAELEARRV